MNINPGELNKRIEIISLEMVKDEDGFEHETEVPMRKCWAKFTRKSIKQITDNFDEKNLINARFVIRYPRSKSKGESASECVQQGMFVKYNGLYYHIEYVNEYADSHEYIEIGCKEGVVNV